MYNPTQHRTYRIFAWLLPLALWLSSLPAQPQQGAISGIVSSRETGALLPGAAVRIMGTNLATETDREGRYRLAPVPPGEHIVRISYLGLAEHEMRVTVPAGQSIGRNVELGSEVMQLAAFRVEASAEPSARALNQQRTANTIKNIVSADAFGVLPDATAAEALARLPGITIDRDRGEGSTVTVRGLSPALNNVSLDGQRLPSNEGTDRNGDGRTTRLEAVPTELIGQIEVTKAATPDMDADFLGANINLRTRSAFDFKLPFTTAKVQYKYNEIISGHGKLATISHYQRFGRKENLGAVLAVTYEDDHTSVEHAFLSYYPALLTRNGATFPVFNTVDLRNREQWRERSGANASLEWRLNEGRTAFTLRGYYNDYVSKELNRRYRVVFPNPATAAAAALYSADTTAQVAKVTSATSAFRNTIDFQNDRAVESYALDFRHQSLAYKLSGTASLIDSRNRQTQRNAQFRLNNVPNLAWDRRDPENPQIAGDVFQYDRFFLFDLTLFLPKPTKDIDRVGQIDFERPFSLAGFPTTFKTGLKYRGKERDVTPSYRTLTYVGPQIFLPQFLEDDPRDYYQGGLRLGRLPSVDKLDDYSRANPTRFNDTASQADATLQNRYDATEDIYGTYAMVSAEVGKLRLIGGVRLEATELKVHSTSFEERSGRYLPSAGTGSYRNWFPGLIGNYRFTDRIILRGAWTNTVARPNYGSLVPFERINRDLFTISRGNPKLGAAESMNYDVSLEFYLQPRTVFSINAFYKDVKKFAFTQVSEEQRAYAFLNPATGVSEVTSGIFAVSQPQSGSTLKIHGVELDLQQSLNFLPGFLRGLSTGGNVTFIGGKSVFFSLDARNNPVPRAVNYRPRQSDFVGNLYLAYDYKRFSAKVAYNYTGKWPQSLGTSAATDQWVEANTSLSASLNWRLARPGWSVFVTGANLGRVGRLLYEGDKSRPLQRELASWSATTGINLRR